MKSSEIEIGKTYAVNIGDYKHPELHEAKAIRKYRKECLFRFSYICINGRKQYKDVFVKYKNVITPDASILYGR